MKVFIKSMDEKAWRALLTGWNHPIKKSESIESMPKSEMQWSANDDKWTNSNSKALNAIFNSVDMSQFKLISTCESAKEAQENLKSAHEETDSVKLSKLKILTTRLEDLRMNKEESISEFNERSCDIANEAFSLREKFTEEKLIRKALRYLPKRFTYNVIVIEEAKDL